MESFLKLISDNEIVYSVGVTPTGDDSSLELRFSKFLQKTVFKRDFKIEFEEILKAICSSEPFAVKSCVFKEMIAVLNSTLLSKRDDKFKIFVFRCVFQTFISSWKENEKLGAFQFFIVLVHILGVDVLCNENVSESGSVVNAENFNNAFEVEISPPLEVSYLILKELLVCLSKELPIINSVEKSTYHKWFQKLIKKIANTRPFQSIFLDIFSVCIGIDVKLVEKSLETIIGEVLSQRPPVNEDFSKLYENFLESGLKMNAKLHRSVKFIKKVLLSIKTTPTVLAREMILPSSFVTEFSKTVALSSMQQSLLLLDSLLLCLNECFVDVSENNLGCQFLSIICELLTAFLKEVKIFAPNTSATTLKKLMNKLNLLNEILEKFGNFLFSKKVYMSKNENVITAYLQLCLYCGEVQELVDYYKDSILRPSELEILVTEKKWLCSLSLKQWKNLINFVLKSNMEVYNGICFQLAMHKLRTLKLYNADLSEDSTLKMILSQFELGKIDSDELSLLKLVTPEDISIIFSFVGPDQAKIISSKIFATVFNSEKMEWKIWLRESEAQENLSLIVNLFSEVLKKIGTILASVKFSSKFSWLLKEFFSDDNNIYNEHLEDLPVKINNLLQSWRKIRKGFGKNLEEEKDVMKAFELFNLLPVNHLKEGYRKLGLSLCVAIAIFLCHDENAVCRPLESMCHFLGSETDASTCFDIGLCLKWLCELSFETKEASDFKIKVVEALIRSSPNSKFGLSQMGEMIEMAEGMNQESPMKMLETRVVFYQELGKCWQRAKKRKADNDLIGNLRKKLAKVISDGAKNLGETEIESENCKLFFRIFSIELHKALQLNEEEEISALMERKFSSYFDFAVKRLKDGYDEPSASFLTFVLASSPQLKKFLSAGSFLKMWKSLRHYEKGNWRLFCSFSDDDEFKLILSDLLEITKKWFTTEPGQYLPNYFEIWSSFFEFTSESKRQPCQLLLQDLFSFTHRCDMLLATLSVDRKINLIKFYSFCVSSEKVILTSHMLDTVIHVMVEFLDDSSSVEDFHNLFVIEVDTALAILLRQFIWSKNKLHLSFVLFKRLMTSLTKRSDVTQRVINDDVIKLSTCAFVMEKWVKLMVSKKKEFSRTVAYFIMSIISVIASTTILPAIKFHLINCINHFLSISDSHTVAYLMRVLKPGYQQVFSSIYQQFKKYHKYSGKI